jgi:hypothetical protein
MKHYFSIEIGVLAGLTATLLSIPNLGGPLIVAPVIVVAWIILQLVSVVAFCLAINKGTILTYQASPGSKETYEIASGRRPGWLVMRHVWAYRLIGAARAGESTPDRSR